MTEIQILDKLFDFMKAKPNNPISISQINRLLSLGINDDMIMRNIEVSIINTKLVDYKKGNAADWYSLQLNHLGISELSKYQSYSNYLEHLHAEQASKTEIDELSRKKLKIDLANAERIYKTYKSTRILAWSGFIFGLIALILKLLEMFGTLPFK